MFKLARIARFVCTTTATAALLAVQPALANPAPAPRASKAAPAAAAVKTGRETIDGVAYYYEVRGRGEPLLLLHGGSGPSTCSARSSRSSRRRAR